MNTTLEFTLAQAAILKQMAEAWERHLQSLLRAAKARQQEMAINNTEFDLREVDKILAMLGRPRITADPKPAETTTTKPKYAIRDDIIDA